MPEFLSFQYPVEIPGVTNVNFLKASVNAVRKGQGKNTLDAIEFLSFIREKCQLLEMDESFLYRSINEGFSGGEKKRNEILQMAALEPKLAILDETDSGLDIDALRIISHGVNAMRSPERSIILVTHYQRLLDYIEPDFIHVLVNGRIIMSGDKSLALELEKKDTAGLRKRCSDERDFGFLPTTGKSDLFCIALACPNANQSINGFAPAWFSHTP